MGERRDGSALRLAAAPRNGANGRYRALLPLRELARRGHTVHWPGDPTYRALERGGVPREWDALYVQQMHDEEAREAMARLRRAGVAVVWDTDDDLSAVRRGSEAYHHLGGRRMIRRHFKQAVEAARTAHVMTTTSDRLAEVYGEAGVERVHVIENYLAPQDVAVRRRRHQGVVIGITAAGEHEPDLRKLRLGALLERLLERRDGVRVVAIGADLRMTSHRYTFVRPVPIEQLIAHEAEFDLALAPLLDTAFNRARSNVKRKEYAAAGAAWLASPVGPYRGMGEEQGGLLVEEDGWLDALTALVDDDARRRALVEQGRRWVAGQTIKAGGAAWQTAFRDAVAQARGG